MHGQKWQQTKQNYSATIQSSSLSYFWSSRCIFKPVFPAVSRLPSRPCAESSPILKLLPSVGYFSPALSLPLSQQTGFKFLNSTSFHSPALSPPPFCSLPLWLSFFLTQDVKNLGAVRVTTRQLPTSGLQLPIEHYHKLWWPNKWSPP